MKTVWTAGVLCLAMVHASAAGAAELLVSIGIRETGGTGPVGADGGASGGIEWVNRDGQSLTADGTWQLFTFTPANDTLTPFAGTTADGILDTEWGTLEHIRFANTADGFTAYRVWIDDAANEDSAGVEVVDFEPPIPVGTEVIFQEPSFSGSTTAHLNTANFNSAGVDDSMAFAGSQSYLVEFEFIDDDPTRWLRLTSFNSANLPNPAVHLSEPGAATQPTISFYAKAIAIPEPTSSVAILLAAGTALLFWRRS